MNIPIHIPVKTAYFVGAFVGFFLVAGLINEICGNPDTAGQVAFLFAAWMVWTGFVKDNDFVTDIDQPVARPFPVSDFEVFAAIKDVMHNNIDDKWWTAKLIDDAPDEDGNSKMKYVTNFEEPHPPVMGQAPPNLKRQIILDVTVNKVGAHTCVRLSYLVTSPLNRFACNTVVEKTSAMIWTKLDKLVAKRTAPKASGQAAYEF